MKETHSSLRDLYVLMKTPGDNPLRDAHSALDKAVCKAYGISGTEDHLEFLLKLNRSLSEDESKGKVISGPGFLNGLPTLKNLLQTIVSLLSILRYNL